MKTITKTIDLYSFDELSEKSKENAIDNLYAINVDHEWWDCTYDDAAEVGIKLTGFDIGRGSYCEGHFIGSAIETADKIISNHGEVCDTWKTAKSFLTERDKLVEKYSDGIDKNKVAEDNEWEFDNECDELEDDFRKDLLNDYLTNLREDYEYKTSREAIIETIEANEYTFTEDGKLYN